MKGFGKQAQTKPYQSVYSQMEFLVGGVKSGSYSETIPVFGTSLKRKDILSQVASNIAVKYPEYHFQVMMLDSKQPGVIILPHSKNKKSFSYTWVERSDISGKWLVMASPPGAWDYRCLCVWKEKEVALEVSLQVFDRIVRMSLFDWQKGRGEYLRLLRSLPLDDDSIIGLIDSETGKTINFDAQVQEQLLPLFNQSLLGDEDASSQLEVSLNQLRLEG